jgi:hypothetical protein
MASKFVVESVQQNRFRISQHATMRRIQRGISISELKRVLLNGKIIERNPRDKPYPSFLVLGWLRSGDPLHVKCSRGTKEPRLRIVILYEPSDEEWEKDYATRKKRR